MNKVKIGIIGCGRISDLHAKGYFECEKSEIFAVCDKNEKMAQKKMQQWGAKKYYTDYRRLLEDPDVDAVDVLTPHTLHEEVVVAALESGKHTAVQKPVSIDLKSTDRMISAANKSGKIFKVTENYIFYPPIMKAKEIIDSGLIGNPQNIRINLIGAGAGGWEVPKEAWAWRLKEFSESRGMETFDHGHHLWSTAWYLMGEISEISAWIDNTEGMIDAPAMIMWKHKQKGRYGNCSFSYCNEMKIPSDYYANDEWIDICGSKGILRINRCTGKLLADPVVSTFDNAGWTHYPDIESDWQRGFSGSVNNFIEAILGNVEPALSGKDAKTIMKINLAIQKSARSQKSVYIDELEEKLPEAYNRHERNKNKANFKSFMKSLSPDHTQKDKKEILAQKAESLSLELPTMVDNSKIGDWTGKILLILKENNENFYFSLEFVDGRLEVSKEKKFERPDLTITTSPSTWAEILCKKKNIQKAFISGKLKFSGEMDQGFKLKEVTGL